MTDLNKKKYASLRAQFDGANEDSIWLVSQKRLFASERIDQWLQFCKKEISLPVYELVLVDDFVWKMFSPVLERGIRRNVELSRFDKTFLAHTVFTDEIADLIDGRGNQYTPGIYLLDRTFRVRWQTIAQFDTRLGDALLHSVDLLKNER